MSCTFFGNRDAPNTIRNKLHDVIEELIEEGVVLFYVGNEGNFDRMVLEELRSARQRHCNIEYYVVLANRKHNLPPEITLYPEGIEYALPKFTIDYRNRWMLKNCDTVVTYIRHPGGASKYRDAAIRQRKRIIDLT